MRYFVNHCFQRVYSRISLQVIAFRCSILSIFTVFLLLFIYMMEEEDSEFSIDDIKLWTVVALKDFLRKRNLKVSGRKEELVL